MLITPKRRNGTITDTKRGGRTCVWGSSQKSKGRGATSKTASQLMMPAPEASLAPERDILEGSVEDELVTDGTVEKSYKKA